MSIKTLLVVAPYFPPHRGGLERYAYEIAQRHTNLPDWNVVVLTTSDTAYDVVEERDGMKLYRLGYTHKLSNTPFSFHWPSRVRHIIQEVSPDVIHIHTPVPGLGDLASFLAPQNVPQLVTYHGGSMKKGKVIPDTIIALYENLILPLMLRRARHIVCSSDFVRTNFLRRHMHKSSTVTPGVDTAFFTPKTIKESNPTILTVGGLGTGEEHKGLERMITVLPTLLEQIPTLLLTVVGDGNRRTYFENKVHTMGLGKHVRFLGAQDSEGMRTAYQNASVFVLPTTNDSFPTVILEAMACGLPVVSTTVGSIDAMVEQSSTGYLVAPSDTSALSKRIIEILNNEELRLTFGARSRERVSRHFTWERTVMSYTNVYETIGTTVRTVAHVVAYYPPHTGGMEIVAERLARGLASRGYCTEVLTSTCGAGSVSRTEYDTNYRVRRLPSVEFAHTPVMWTLPFHLLALPRNTLVHLHIAQALLPEITMGIAKLRGFTVVAHFHLDVEPSGRLGWLFVIYKKYVLPHVLRSADAVLVASQGQADVLRAMHGVSAERIHLITNGVDTLFFKEPREHVLHSPLRILTVSRLTIQKRVDRLLEAMPHIGLPAELIIVGDGEDREKLEAQARAVYPGHVQFVGFKQSYEIAQYHAWADLFVIPSDKEGGMPLTALEAMAAGLPIVAADAPGVTDIVAGVGIVVTDPSSTRLAEAITNLANDNEAMRTLSAKSRTCAESHTWDVALESVCAAYSAIASDMNLGKASRSA